MKTNRKKAMGYKFNGVWGIAPVRIADLESLIEKFAAKLSDPDDLDDKKWTTRWLLRFQMERTKKERGLEHKQRRG